ncbi:hypothetical protein STANM309S_06457 [Streptomyces tanashiensis]
MLWLTWRQFRTQAAVVYAAVAALAATLAVTGPRLSDLYRTAGSSLVDQVSKSGPDPLLRRVVDRTRRAGSHRDVLGRAADLP